MRRARASIFPPRVILQPPATPRWSGFSATPPRHRPRVTPDRQTARRWSAPCAARSASAYWPDRTRRCSRRRCSRAPASLFCPCVRLEPGEAIGGLAARVVFAADKAAIAEPVELIEQERIVQFLAVRLVARWNAGDLDVADDRHHLAQAHGDVAMDDLAMIDVELQF